MMNAIAENGLIERITARYSRSPLQLNRIHETDAEILRIPGSAAVLAVTTDSVVEEIATGLYANPYLIGWMTVMMNLSDLAATGASPIGMLISETLPQNAPEQVLADLHNGIADACKTCGTHVLGGDTNVDKRLMLTGCAFGIIPDSRVLRRVGCRVGDGLYSTGMVGLGNAFALTRLCGDIPLSIAYQPVARLNEGQTIGGMATACMDTSDGVLATLDQLMRLNNVGFEFDDTWPSALHPEVVQASGTTNLPPWLFLAGPHGEFELLFTVAPEKERALLDAAQRERWSPVRLGCVIEQPVIRLAIHGARANIDTGWIRNLSSQATVDTGSYVAELLKMDEDFKKGDYSHATD